MREEYGRIGVEEETSARRCCRMLIDRYPKEDIFARVPKMTGRIDPVLQQLDRLLDDDEVYQQCGRTSANDTGRPWCMDAIPRQWKCCCACSCSSTCSAGAIRRPKIGSTRAWCCAGSLACS